MTSEKFNELWIQIGNAAQDIVNTCNDGTQFNQKKKEYISFEYDKFRRFCKERHLRSAHVDITANDVKEPEISRIDRHKIGACIAGAILSAKPLEYTGSDVGRKRISYLANETLALFSALAIVKSFIRSDKESLIQFPGAIKEDFLSYGFKFPQPQYDEYLPWLLYLLQESTEIGFNVLSFSNILYLLEVYTISQLELEQMKRIEKQDPIP